MYNSRSGRSDHIVKSPVPTSLGPKTQKRNEDHVPGDDSTVLHERFPGERSNNSTRVTKKQYLVGGLEHEFYFP